MHLPSDQSENIMTTFIGISFILSLFEGSYWYEAIKEINMNCLLVWRELLIWGNQSNSSHHTFSVSFTTFFNLPSVLWCSFLLWKWNKKLYYESDIMCIRNIWRYVYALELHSFCCLYEVYVFLQQFVGVKQLLCHYNH